MLLICLLAFYVACNLGANDVANSMGTSIGSKAITLRQALTIAALLESTGAVLFGQRVSQTLISGVIDPAQFASAPTVLAIGMIAALLACGIWLQIATAWGLPVASSHAIVGAIAGFGWVAIGTNGVNWRSIGIISLTWVLTPLISGSIAAGFYSLIRHWILDQSDPLRQMDEWIPWLSAALVGVFGILVLPSVARTLPIAQFPLPTHAVSLGVGAIGVAIITVTAWNQSRSSLVEQQMGRFQLLSACCVAFAHGSNDVGNAVAPLAAIVSIRQTGAVPESDLEIPIWILGIGAAGIVLGLAVWGKTVIETIGEGIIPLQPSSGFCAELATAATILAASRLGLPVSTSHALVGAVVGIGLVQYAHTEPESQIRLRALQPIALAWFATIPVAGGFSAGLFALMRHFF